MTDVRERITDVPAAAAGRSSGPPLRVRSLTTGPQDAAGHLVVVPGLGLLGYLLPFARALADRGVRCTLLDVPGFGAAGPLVVTPSVQAVAAVTAGWLRGSVTGPGTLAALFGHSTGAQAALAAALAVQGEVPLRSVVLAGPTFAPRHRTVGGLLVAGPPAYRRDSPRELVVAPDLLRGGARVIRLIRDAQRDRPEGAVAALRPRLLLTAGRADSLVPPDWFATLAAAARGAESVHAVRLPGSHNNPWTQPALLASLVAGHLLV